MLNFAAVVYNDAGYVYVPIREYDCVFLHNYTQATNVSLYSNYVNKPTKHTLMNDDIC